MGEEFSFELLLLHIERRLLRWFGYVGIRLEDFHWRLSGNVLEGLGWRDGWDGWMDGWMNG